VHALMVCTNDTGILFVAMELARCPPTWNAASGAVVFSTYDVGHLSPPCSPGIALPTTGTNRAIPASVMHHVATKPNWRMVRVNGRGRAFRIDFDEVLESALVRYQIIHRAFPSPVSRESEEGKKVGYVQQA
jgi:hypothetical protein